ncbi:MAG: FeoA family protein, partial [Myxococcota bacterium]
LDQDPDVLRYLTRVGLTISKVFQVTEVLPFDGQMFLSLDDTESISVSQSLATRLMVSRMH